MKFLNHSKLKILRHLTGPLLLMFSFVVPLLSRAQSFCGGGSFRITEFRDLICIFGDIINLAIPVVIALALLAFFWGLAKLILNAGDSKGREEGRHVIILGIIGLFVAISIFGILQFFYEDIVGGYIDIPPRLPEF